MPRANFFFPPCENILPGVFGGIIVPRSAGPIDPLVEYDNTIFELKLPKAGNLYGRVRELTVAGSLAVADSGMALAAGSISLVIGAIRSGVSLSPLVYETELSLHGGWYGAAITQPAWDIGDPGPIAMRIGECAPLDGFRTVASQRYIAFSGTDTAGPFISFLEGFLGVGQPGLSFGQQIGFNFATVNGVLPAVLNIPESGFTLKLAGPSNSGSFTDLSGILTITPTKFWTHGGKYDETTGALV